MSRWTPNKELRRLLRVKGAKAEQQGQVIEELKAALDGERRHRADLEREWRGRFVELLDAYVDALLAGCGR